MIRADYQPLFLIISSLNTVLQALKIQDHYNLTCWSHFMEVIFPGQNDAGFARPTLHGPSCQSRKAEVGGEVD